MRSNTRAPLTKRLRPRHWVVLDYAAGVILGLVVYVSLRRSFAPQLGAAGRSGIDLLALIMAAVAAIAVARRRRRPGMMLGVLLAGSVVVAVLSGGAAGSMAYFVPAAYVLYLVIVTFESRHVAVRALVAVFAAILVDAVFMALSGGVFISGRLIPVTLFVVLAWSTGYIVRQRRRYAIGLQEEAASKAVAEERLRIARELHDVVAHSMSVIAVQAGYGQYVIDSQPADARAALGAIQTTSREALDEMRRMLGALRPAHSDAPRSPAPGLAELDRLIARTASAGVQVELRQHGRAVDLPPSIDMSAYRIIQEALTNVVKHAHASRCEVLIGYGAGELTVEVTDSGAGVLVLAGAPGADSESAAPVPGNAGGHGIIGMRERVGLLGGEFSAGPLPGYGFQVIARLPLPADGAA